MIDITNGSMTIKVTKGAYNELYAPIGFTIVGANKVLGESENSSQKGQPEAEAGSEGLNSSSEINPEEDSEDEDFSEDENELFEKPLREMSLVELKSFAEYNEVNIEGLTTKREIRTEIRKSLEN